MGVYAANRLASIAENSEISQEIMEAFADESRETAHISSYGVIAQIHENDLRMFDAIISADFASVSNGKILEGAELAAVNEKMEKVTAKGIWEKIKGLIKAIKDTIIKIARIFRDKVMDLIKVDKKIVARYGSAIRGAKQWTDVEVNFELPTVAMKAIANDCDSTYDKIADQAKAISDIIAKLDKDTKEMDNAVQTAKDNISKANEELIKKVEVFNNQKKSTIKKSDAVRALDDLDGGKEIIKEGKKNADKALKVVQEMEKAAKAAQSKKSVNAAVGAKIYSVVSGIGAGTHKAMNTVNNGLVKILAAERKIVLAAGRTALYGYGKKEEDKAQNEAVLDALFMSSDLFVAEMCEMV